MLNAHKDVFCVERRLFGNYADFVIDEGVKTPRLRITFDKYIKSMLLHHGLPKRQEVNLIKSVLYTIEKQERKLSGKNILIDKITPYLNTSEHVLNQLNTYYPKSKLVFLVRDGRDVLTSGVFHWFNKQSPNIVLSDFEKERIAAFKNNQEANLDRFFLDQEIEDWGRHWVQAMQIIEKAKQTHDVKIVHYEDMLKDAKKELNDIFSFLAIKKKDYIIEECLEAGSFKNMSRGRDQGQVKQDSHVRKGIIGDWKNYFTKEDGRIFNEIAGDMLLKYNYVVNKDWFNEI
jgi:hypothetical protein